MTVGCCRLRWSDDGGRTWQDETRPDGWRWEEQYAGQTYTRSGGEGALTRAANGWLVAALRTDLPVHRYRGGQEGVDFHDSLCGTAGSVSKDDGKT